MNLVQLQDDLRMLPLPLLDAKAKGQDPNTPPWLAAAVLNERISAQQKAGMAQGAAQGKQPSVAEQLQQKAGLMSLQARQQQQAQQQMMQQMAQAPQPAPEGIPQPERQPEPEMMARGGLARLPINPRMFNYKEGGIIGFAGGGTAEDLGSKLDAVKERAAQALARLRTYGLNQQRQDPEGYKQAQQEAQQAGQDVKNAMALYQTEMQKSGMDKPYFGGQRPSQQPAPPPSPRPVMANDPRMPLQYKEIPGYKPASSVSPELEEILRQEWIKEGGDPNNFRINLQTKGGVQATPEMFGLSSLRQNVAQPAPQAAPIAKQVSAPQADTITQAAPQPAETQQPAGSPAYDYSQALQNAIKRAEGQQGVTPEQARARFEATQPDILKEQAGLGQLARLKQQQEQYDKSKEDRAIERLISVMGARAKSGLGGYGTGYLSAITSERAADAAQAKYQNDVMTAVESAQRGEATAQQKALLDMINKGEENKAKAISDQMTGAVHGYSTSQTAQTAAAQRLSEEKRSAASNISAQIVASIQADAREKAKALGVEEASIRAAEQAFANDPSVKMMMKEVENAIVPIKPERMKVIEDRLRQIQSEKYKAHNLPDPNANKAAPTAPRMRFDAKGNLIP